VIATDKDKIQMALNRLAVFEAGLDAGERFTHDDLRDLVANIRLRLEHGSPGDTIACFARGAE
jgi:hypothetical protein